MKYQLGSQNKWQEKAVSGGSEQHATAVTYVGLVVESLSNHVRMRSRRQRIRSQGVVTMHVRSPVTLT
jgi:hypothetical protein